MTDQITSALDAPDLAGALDLTSDFPAATKAEWRRLVGKVLGDAVTPEFVDAPERLLVTTVDGLEIQPLYTADDTVIELGYPGQYPFVRGSTAVGQRAGWDVRQRHAHPDPVVAREQIMADLDGGVTSIWLGLGEGQIPIEALPGVLAEVYLDLATVVLDAGAHTVAAAGQFFELLQHRDLPVGQLRASLGADPVGVAARTGAPVEFGAAAELAARCATDFPQIRAFVVDALPFHDAGGGDAEELGCSLASGVAYLREMQAAGLSGDVAFGQLEFRYAATTDQFATIAKLRAARRLWARIADSCGVSGVASAQRQHAVTSWPMMTRRDPWNNMLRATLACFAAGVAGADAVTVLPFDAAIGTPDDLARRIARNTHALLVEESNVARVIDPAGGSWYVENLTDSLAEAAWSWFQVIERAGGIAASLRSNLVADRMAATRDERLAALAHGQDAITGVSEFPLRGETVLNRVPSTAADDAGGLPRIRWAQWHEALRDRSDAYTAATGAPPTVELVAVGAARDASAQADRVRALLAPAGVETVDTDVGDATAGVVCLCVAGDVKSAEVVAAFDALRAAGVGHIVVAGATIDAADEQIAAGMDALAFQTRTLAALGVAS